jgi:hypothetical protein
MSGKIKQNSFLIAALAAVFYIFFMYTKHNPSLAAIIPFGNDPYDAIGSYTVIFTPLLVVLSLLRTMRGHGSYEAPDYRKIFLIRTQVSVPLAIILTLSADLIAMIRYRLLWMNNSSTLLLMYLILGMIILSIWVLFLVHRAGITLYETHSIRIKGVFITSVVYIVVLAIYPQAMTESVFCELVTLAVCILLFFIPLAVLTENFIPYRTTETEQGRNRKRQINPWLAWLIILSMGILLGLFILAGELTKKGGGRVSFSHILTVALVYIGTTTLAAVIGFIAMKKPLGLDGKEE